jgi:hypothetical protein|tara:strand:+ start:128 stop:406 length:279 start_codon:yes stop_codon:yes gene_type:complete
MKHKTKSVLVTRMPRVDDNEFKTASIKLFSINDPHKTEELPKESFEYPNVEKIIIKSVEVDYFLEGNDLIINNLEEIEIEQKGTIVEIRLPN